MDANDGSGRDRPPRRSSVAAGGGAEGGIPGTGESLRQKDLRRTRLWRAFGRRAESPKEKLARSMAYGSREAALRYKGQS